MGFCGRLSCAAAGVLIAAVPAYSDTITLPISPKFGSAQSTGASGIVTLSFMEQGSDDVLTVDILNSTPSSIGSKLTGLGLEMPDEIDLPIVFAAGGEGPYLDTLEFNESLAPPSLDSPGGYDLVITSDKNFQGGNPNGAPSIGESETIALNLGDTSMTPEQLHTLFNDFYIQQDDNFVIARFQAVGPSGKNSDKVLGAIPEPSSLILLLVGASALMRRRRA